MSLRHWEGPVTDPLDLVGSLFGTGLDTVVVNRDQLPGAFFDLPSGLAGEWLQKFSNYHKKLVIVGTFDDLASKPWRDFIRESNRTGRVVFVPSVEEGERLLASRGP